MANNEQFFKLVSESFELWYPKQELTEEERQNLSFKSMMKKSYLEGASIVKDGVKKALTNKGGKH